MPAAAPFIVGAGGRATALVRAVLDAHPGLAVVHDSRLPQEFFRQTAREETTRAGFCSAFSRMKVLAALGLDERALAELLPPGRFAFAEGLRRCYVAYATRFGKARWGDETPRYVLTMRAVQRALPEARFIHVIEDARSALFAERRSSDAAARDRAADAARWSAYWAKCLAHARKQAPSLSHYLEVRYEEFGQDAEGTLRRLCAFLEIDYDAAMRDAVPPQREEGQELSPQDLAALGGVPGEAAPRAAPDAKAERALRDAARLERRRDYDGALARYAEAARLAPDRPECLGPYANLLERLGRFGEAWDALSRLSRLRSRGDERWDGAPLTGKHVVLHRRLRQLAAEIRQARFIVPLARDAASCTVLADARLRTLFARSFPQARIVAATDAPPPGVQLGYEEAAALYGRTEQALRESFVPLVADAAHTKQLAQRYRSSSERLVGIAWASANERKRLPILADWKPVLEMRGCRFVSLQYGDFAADLATLNRMASGPLIVDGAIDQLVDMDGFAAQVAAMDVVLCISSTAAHLAGALGRPTIVLFDEDDAQSWQHCADTSPWYPRLRIARRRGAETWPEVMTRARLMMERNEP